MARIRTAYLPIATYPETVADAPVLAAAGVAAALGCALRVTTFSVDVPRVSTPLAGLLVDVPGLVESVEGRSRADCARLQAVVTGAAAPGADIRCTTRQVVLGAAVKAAASEARYHALAVLPWAAGAVAVQDMAQSVVFGSGRPAILVPPSAGPERPAHLAIAWDGSAAAARALGDALPLLPEGGHVSVLTVQGEKKLGGSGIAGTLAATLRERGYEAAAVEVALGGRAIAGALQETALAAGAQLMAMGGFGHSRLRDFVLGGATTGVFADLCLPVLLSH